MSENIFKIHGYSVDVFVHNKLVGNFRLDEPDRETFGYSGRKTEIIKQDIELTNKKIVKAGTKIMSECSPICGRTIKPIKWTKDVTDFTNQALLEFLKQDYKFHSLILNCADFSIIKDYVSGQLKLECTNEQYLYIQAYWQTGNRRK